jgi:hypothetical protein
MGYSLGSIASLLGGFGFLSMRDFLGSWRYHKPCGKRCRSTNAATRRTATKRSNIAKRLPLKKRR